MQISSNPYKGTRDFYPIKSVISGKDINYIEQQNYLFERIKHVLKIFSFQEYKTSVVEDKTAFEQKSGGNLGSLELYNFTDKGGRLIALRPELTLSAARSISNLFTQLRFPLRWFSVDNCFRYERPQKGRQREFWQVEVNIVGEIAGAVDLEVVILALEILKTGLGAKKEDYILYYNHRPALDKWVEHYNFTNRKQELYKILDNWFKFKTIAEKKSALQEHFNDDEIVIIYDLAQCLGQSYDKYIEIVNEYKEMVLIQDVLENCVDKETGEQIYNTKLHPCIIRGQAYYTGLVFEVFDTDIQNNRSLFGGGRFDDLLDLYGKKSPAVGFAPGDAPLHEFMMGHNLYPDFASISNKPNAIISLSDEETKSFYTNKLQYLLDNSESFELDTDYKRSLNKRRENNIKRGNSVS